SVLHAVNHDDPVVPPSDRSLLWHTIEALGAAAAAIRRFFGAAPHTSAWALIVLITAGRLGGWCFAWQTIFNHQRSRFPGG
ncbi:MAG TPA: hypothetical protein VME67_20355, partial [Mycobacterium sp.]